MRLSRAALLLLLLLVCSSSSLLAPAAALIVEVSAGEVFEMTEPVAVETVLTFQFSVTGEQYLGVKLLSSGSGAVIKDFGPKATEGVHMIQASDKALAVTVQLDNSASSFATVRANIHFRHDIDHSIAASVKELDPIERKVQQLTAAMHKLQTLQTTLKTQQKNHRSTVEDANERVLLWSIFQVLALVAMSGFQLYFLKRFLEKKSFV